MMEIEKNNYMELRKCTSEKEYIIGRERMANNKEGKENIGNSN